MMKKTEIKEVEFTLELREIVNESRQFAYSSVNAAQVRQNWLIGQKLVMQEQEGKQRAEYGKRVIKLAAESLTRDFGRGFSERNLWKFKQFYLYFRELPILPTVSAESAEASHPILLSWSHYERLLRVTDKSARDWYENEASKQCWSVRMLDRNISTMYYQRLLSSQAPDQIKEEIKSKSASLKDGRLDFIKNPTVLEFLGLPPNKGYTETILEQAIIDEMQKFLLELGKGFSFVARQQLIRTDTADFYIDLVFYNFILKCFVIIELKTHALTHQDIGQLDMYVRMYDDLKKSEADGPTIGILLCTETDKTMVKYSVLSENKSLFVTKYMAYLPSEEELAAEIERQKSVLREKISEYGGREYE